jgi:uncharacterized repeat protein (TIGR01451 family)
MKTSPIQGLKWAALGVLIGATPAGAQGLGFGLSVTPSSDLIAVGNAVTYTVNITNGTGLVVSDLFVTNAFSTTVSVGSVIFTIGNGVNFTGSVFTNPASVVLDLKQFAPTGVSAGVAQATLTVVPNVASFPSNGFFTNAVVAIAPALQNVPNTASTNVVGQVTNTIVQADLAVSVSGFGQGILAGDTLTYKATVINHGPGLVPSVLLTNTLPPGTALINVSPTNGASSLANGVLIIDMGTLSNAASSAVTLAVQPTNAGFQTFTVSVGAANLEDPNPANNFFRTNIEVGEVIPGQITATNVSAMTFDPQTGLMNQTVRLSNISTSSVASVRLTVSGLTNWLYNAVGTNHGNPFVVYANTFDPGQTTDLVLEYFVPTRVPIDIADTNYTALGTPAFIVTAPGGTNGVFSITRTVLLSDGNLLIEFPSVLGATYSILYSSNADFSTPLIAQPNIIAPADRVQWIDDGPPKTVSPPASEASRFYRVRKN